MGDGRVVEEKIVPCPNGGSTLFIVEGLGTTTVAAKTAVVGSEYVILGNIISGGIVSPKYRVSFERRLRRLRAARSSSYFHSVRESIDSEPEMEVRDDRRLLDESPIGLGLLDETGERWQAGESPGAGLGASKKKAGDRSRPRDDVPARAGLELVSGSRRKATWIAVRASFFVRETIGLRGRS